MSDCGCSTNDKFHRLPEGTATDQHNPKDIAPTNPAGITHHYSYPMMCQCGCLELRERVAILETTLYQLTLMINNKEKAEGNPQPPRRRYIGDKEAAV